MATIAMTMDNLESTIENNDIVLIDFWADWCGPCKMFGPIFENLSNKHVDIVFAKVDTEAEQALAAQFGIQSIPTVAAFRENILVFAQPGALPAEALEELIKQLRALDMDDVRAQIEKAHNEQELAGDN
ncbi:MAG: thioredoxin [Rhodospirillales bacterium]|nr:thioredoxin [Rhodospirillales bacterium]